MSRLLPLCLGVMLLTVIACADRPDEDSEDAIRAAIAELRVGERAAMEVDAELAFEDQIEALKKRGVSIEPILIEELGASESWGVRLGIIEVLEGLGTKACVGAMLGALQDEHPLVAWQALQWLEVVLDHSETPATPTPEHPLPPLPRDCAAADWHGNWCEYRRRYGAVLHQRWTAWWEKNRDSIDVR
jgi:hypothetical protein